jgi:hypothetical protein
VAADIENIMSAAAHPHTRSHQALFPSLLVEHVSRIGLSRPDRPSAADRLGQELGPELAARLVSALAGDHAVRRVV